MYSDIWYQVVLFLVFFGFGSLCAFVFDAFRVSERFGKSNIIMSVVKDIFFWLIILVLMFAISLKFNNGEIRFFMFAAILLGALTYFKTASKFVVTAMYFLVNFFKRIIKTLLKIIFLPLKLFARIFKKPVFIAISFSKKGLRNLKLKIKFRFKLLKKFKR